MGLPYLTLVDFRTRSLMPAAEVDYVEQDSPGYTAARIAVHTSYLHGRLRKRYGSSLPFGDPTPEIIKGWLTMLVTIDVLRKRGINFGDPAAQGYVDDAKRALDEIKEAADSQTGLFDLPAIDSGDSNVTTGGPLGFSDAGPYAWQTRQAVNGSNEDAQNTDPTWPWNQ